MRFAIIGGKHDDRVIMEMPEPDVLQALTERLTAGMGKRKAAKLAQALTLAWDDTREAFKARTAELPI